MERRKAVIAAATASLSLLAGGAAISLGTGIVGASGGDGAGQISPVDTSADPATTVYVDEPVASTITDRQSGDVYEQDEGYESDHSGNTEIDHEYYAGADDDD